MTLERLSEGQGSGISIDTETGEIWIDVKYPARQLFLSRDDAVSLAMSILEWKRPDNPLDDIINRPLPLL